VTDMRHESIDRLIERCLPENSLSDQWDVASLHAECLRLLNLEVPAEDWAKEEGIGADDVRERIIQASDNKMAQKAANYGAELMRMAERSLLLQILDQAWKDHLLSLDHLRQGINLRAYAQRDPLNEYKHEAFVLFQEMLDHLRESVTSVLCHVELKVQPAEEEEIAHMPTRPRLRMVEGRDDPATGGAAAAGAAAAVATAPSPWARTPRNAPCPCGSGKKFKHCHGRV
jgi:preprotein translocase subunit SecA